MRHRIAIQGPSPPLLPLLSIDCDGLIVRLGMHNETMALPDLLSSPGAELLGDETMDTSSYEFVLSMVDLHGVSCFTWLIASFVVPAMQTHAVFWLLCGLPSATTDSHGVLRSRSNAGVTQ